MNKNIKAIPNLEWKKNNTPVNNIAQDAECKTKILVIINKDFWKIIEDIRKDFFLWIDINLKYKSNFQDLYFLENLNTYIWNNFWKIAEHGNLNSYNEIYFFLYLFSIKEDLNIYDSWDIYDEKKLFFILDTYFDKIIKSDNLNSKEWNMDLNYCLKLCWLYNIICLLNQNNLLKKDFIFLIIDFISIKINSILPLLNEKVEDENILKWFKYTLWLFKLNYTYITYIDFDSKADINIFLKENENLLLNTISWYNICKDSDFWWNLEKKEIIDRVFITNITFIINIIILKINTSLTDKQNYINNPIFIKIIDLFKCELNKLWLDINLDRDIKDICNFIFINNYKWFNKLNNLTTFENKINTNNFLSQFSNSNFTNKVDNLELIHHILLFNDISDNNLFNILNILLNQESSSNLNYEVIRLKILNIILTKLAPLKDPKLKNYLNRIWDHIDENKIFTHLLYTYSLIYITLSHCYSFFDDNESQNKALINFAKFKEINPKDSLFNKYYMNFEPLYENVWYKRALKYKMIDDICYKNRHNNSKNCSKCSGQNLENIAKIWKWYLEEYYWLYKEFKISELINELDNYLTNNKNNILNLNELKISIEKIFKTLFHWLVSIELFENNNTNIVIDKYKNYKDINIINWYVLRIIYPISFKTDFEQLYYNYSEEYVWEVNSINIENKSIINEIFRKLKDFLERFNEQNKIALFLVANFEKALENNNKYLMFQWIHNSAWEVIKYEVLSRLNLSENIMWKKYNIRDYIDAIILLKRDDLLKILIKKNIERTIEIINKSPHMDFSINIEYNDIIDEDLISFLEKLALNNINKLNITFELIEWKWHNNSIVVQNLKRLKNSGYKIAMDDFGSGESSINRLLSLFEEWIIDYVKIDWEIIKRLNFENNNNNNNININNKKWLLSFFKQNNKKNDWDIESIIKMIVTICKNHNVKIVAEFIENKFVLDYLSKLWVDLFQWYYLSKPLPESEILK